MRVSRRGVGGIAPLVDVSSVDIIDPQGLGTWNGTYESSNERPGDAPRQRPCRIMLTGPSLEQIDATTRKALERILELWF